MAFMDSLEGVMRGMAMQQDPQFRKNVYDKRRAEEQRAYEANERKKFYNQQQQNLGQRAVAAVPQQTEEFNAELFPGEAQIKGLKDITQQSLPAQASTGLYAAPGTTDAMKIGYDKQQGLGQTAAGQKYVIDAMLANQQGLVSNEGAMARNQNTIAGQMARNKADNQALMARQQQEQQFGVANPEMESKTSAMKNQKKYYEIKDEAARLKEAGMPFESAEMEKRADMLVDFNKSWSPEQRIETEYKKTAAHEQAVSEAARKEEYQSARDLAHEVNPKINALQDHIEKSNWPSSGPIAGMMFTYRGHTQTMESMLTNFLPYYIRIMGDRPTDVDTQVIREALANKYMHKEVLISALDRMRKSIDTKLGLYASYSEGGSSLPTRYEDTTKPTTKSVNWSDM